jgi:Spy/CpxP family protein refolding chaperone
MRRSRKAAFMSKDDPLFAKGKARWLLENARKLTPDQRALLLALADLDVAAGHQPTPEERAALDELSAQMEGYDAAEIRQAMKHMVEAQTKRKVVDWPKDLKRRTHPKKPEA